MTETVVYAQQDRYQEIGEDTETEGVASFSEDDPPCPQGRVPWSQVLTVFDQFPKFFEDLPDWKFVEKRYDEIIAKAKKSNRLKPVLRKLCKEDRYFLLTRVLRRPDARKEMIYKLCRMVEADTDGYLDLWSREHYKSTLITFAGSIQEILKDPEITIGIFSFNKPIAKSFLKQIKIEIEQNELLKKIFPDIFWQDPRKESKKYGFTWSVDNGITVKRKSNPKEATVEAWGLTDGQPIGRHFRLRIYNDVVTKDTVRTEGAMKKTEDGWELSLSLGSKEEAREWYEGTIYHNSDVYATIKNRKAAIPRIVPITYNRKEDGVPTVFSREYVRKKRRGMSPYNFACQCLLTPQRVGIESFDEMWLRYFTMPEKVPDMNYVILVDPAGGKGERDSDNTAIAVVGFGSDHKNYVMDLYREKLTLHQRIELLFRLVAMYGPYGVFYEKYGKDSDIESISMEMDRRGFHFDIEAVAGTQLSKKDRIMRLQDDFENGLWWFPKELKKVDRDGRVYNAIQDFVDFEYLEWPFPTHDDVLDVLARKYDIPVVYADYAKIGINANLIEDKRVRPKKKKWSSMEKSRRWG